MNFHAWFSDSAIRDEQGDPLLVYHGTTESKTVNVPAIPGDQDALNKLKALGLVHGIAEYSAVPSVFERWIAMGMAASRGVTPEIARQARTWYELSKPNITPPRIELGFDRFQLPSGSIELGAHFGTEVQAGIFGHVFAFYLSIKNPVRLPDLGTWGYQSVIRELRRRGIEITGSEYDHVFNAFDNNGALRELLMSKGIDGVVYSNEAEGRGDSYIAFCPDQIRRAEYPDQAMGATPEEAENLRPSMAG